MSYQANECSHKNLSKRLAQRVTQNLINQGFKIFNPRDYLTDLELMTDKANHVQYIMLDENTTLIVYVTRQLFGDYRLMITKRLNDDWSVNYYWDHSDIVANDIHNYTVLENIDQAGKNTIKFTVPNVKSTTDQALKTVFPSVRKIKKTGFFFDRTLFEATDDGADFKIKLKSYSNDGCLLDYFADNKFVEK